MKLSKELINRELYNCDIYPPLTFKRWDRVAFIYTYNLFIVNSMTEWDINLYTKVLNIKNIEL